MAVRKGVCGRSNQLVVCPEIPLKCSGRAVAMRSRLDSETGRDMQVGL